MIAADTQDERQGLPSASQLAKIEACPGSMTLSKQAPAEDTKASVRGTLLHEVIAYRLEHTYGETHRKYENEDVSEEDFEQVERAHAGLVKLLASISKGKVNADSGKIEWGACKYWIEERLYYQGETAKAEELFTGKPDLVVAIPTGDEDEFNLLVVDWKFGKEAVKAKGNRQLQGCALLAVPVASEAMNANCRTISTVIVQPAKGVMAEAKYTPKQVFEHGREIFSILKTAYEKTEDYRPGKPCTYCNAKAICPALKLEVTKATQTAIEPDKWNKYSDDEKKEAYRLAKLAKKWAAQVEYMFEGDVREKGIDGYEIGPGRTSFTVTDAQGAYSVLNKALPRQIRAEEFSACCVIQISKLDDFVYRTLNEMEWMTGKHWTTKEAKEFVRETLEPFAEVKTTKGTLHEVAPAIENNPEPKE